MKINGIIILRPINYFNCLIMWRWVRIPNNVCVSESCCCFYIRHKEKGERNNVIIVLWSATSLFRIGIVLSPISSLLMQCNLNYRNYQAHVYECLYQFLSFFCSLCSRAYVLAIMCMYERASERVITRTVSFHRLG